MCTNPDEQLAERLRRENYDQFNTLVRMHLSFVLDLKTVESDGYDKASKQKKKILVPFKKSKYRGVMEGAPLTHEGICQVYQLISFLRQEPNICKEGVFRRTGSLTRQQDLRNMLNRGVNLSLESGPYSVHDCASVLKGFLAELPEPLLTEAHYAAYCQVAELCSILEDPIREERLNQALQLLFLLLPPENRVLLKDVLELLNLTASYEGHNKMSADSLATLFTPHLLCPRKLSPEILHENSQTLSGIISFMIRKSAELFQIPPKLAVDIRAYFNEREKRKCPNESISDNLAANTVFSFVDHERTAKENQSNPTETALAQLYAHIQSLPESSKKRKLVKQFNKENGHGTPLQVLRSNAQSKNKSIGDSIKKHIFHKGLIKSAKKITLTPIRSSSEEILNSPQTNSLRGRLFCTNCDSSAEAASPHHDNDNNKLADAENNCTTLNTSIKRSFSEPELSADDLCVVNGNNYLTSTPACIPMNLPDIAFTPDQHDRKSMSPITRSAQHMCRAMQETMMTPRSRKPVLLVSATNISNLASLNQQSFNKMDDVAEVANEASDSSLTSNFRDYLNSRSILTTDLSFSSRTDDYSSTNIKDLSGSKMSASMLHCMEGNMPSDVEDMDDVVDEDAAEEEEEKQWVIKPKQFDENGQPIVYETSF